MELPLTLRRTTHSALPNRIRSRANVDTKTVLAFAARRRGFHLITSEVLAKLPLIADLKVGILHLSPAHIGNLTINENADPDVRTDMETVFNHLAPERGLPLVHTIEGPDDMPAQLKASLLGTSYRFL